MITPSEAGAAFTAGSCTLYIRKDTDHLTALRDFETIRKCMEVFINDRALSSAATASRLAVKLMPDMPLPPNRQNG